jgi:methylmalonyl-CoA/ethylmalonyl-CoA epimerase
VEGMEEAIKELRKMKYLLLSSPVPAPAISNYKVAFLYNKKVGLIELVESPATIRCMS